MKKFLPNVRSYPSLHVVFPRFAPYAARFKAAATLRCCRSSSQKVLQYFSGTLKSVQLINLCYFCKLKHGRLPPQNFCASRATHKRFFGFLFNIGLVYFGLCIQSKGQNISFFISIPRKQRYTARLKRVHPIRYVRFQRGSLWQGEKTNFADRRRANVLCPQEY